MRLATIIIVALLLIGCSDNSHMQDIQQYMANMQQQPPDPVPSLPAFTQYEYHAYSFNNVQSPFQLTTLENSSILQEYQLASMKMVGILSAQNKRLWGLILLPNGNIYRVKIGQHLGTNRGKVTLIQKDKIVVTEITVLANKKVYKKIELVLQGNTK